jgi:hypothetical protein
VLGPLKIISGTGNGATLKPIELGLDQREVGHMMLQSPVLDSIAKAVVKSPVKDSILSLVQNNLSFPIPDATVNSKGVVRLSGDLTGTADLPLIANNAITKSKIADNSVNVEKLSTNGITDANKFFATDGNGTPVLKSVATFSRDTFTSNFTINGVPNYLKWTNGQVVPAKGKTAVELLLEGSQASVAPSYNSPTASISGNPTATSYEIGTDLGTITLNSNFIQNDAGNLLTSTYVKNGNTTIGTVNGNNSITDKPGKLLAPISYLVTKGYSQGPCKQDNLGIQNCTGQINAGSVSSQTISYAPYYNRYYGFVSSTSPTDSEILGLTQDHTNSKTLTVTLNNPSTPKYICYRFSSLLGALTGIAVNGFPSSASFTITQGSFTNAQGHASEYYLVIGNNLVDNTNLPTTVLSFQ